MQELLALSRSVAADLAAAFHDDPRAELAAWLQIALEREGLVASLYNGLSITSRLMLPKAFARSVIAKVNGICANEETHVTVIRSLLGGTCAWPQRLVAETWGRLQGTVLSHLAGGNAFTRALALILLELGARSGRERAAGRAVAGLDAGGFFTFSRTLELTAVESYQRVAVLLAALRRSQSELPTSLHLKLLRILRDERVHRDVFQVLSRMFGADAARLRTDDAGATTSLHPTLAWPVANRADLNGACRAILAFHYGAVLTPGASTDEALWTAVDYWRWQMDHPRGTSYLVERQRQDLLCPEGEILLLGTAGLQHVVRGRHFIRVQPSQRALVPRLLTVRSESG